ncbi:DNA transposase THAP9 isoform X1 [Pelobates cultripes]|uniref:DNA transposase THAP9 isoform X1 n=1 Tax=Pelobates cultripes TaxID=61616 RepID=A0AAD1RPE3_PELCU|nr:DNA transposase THAP9 isoform X1 [Pelobates cultripes]
MPVSCAASGCKSRYTLEARKKGITFHRFPRSNPTLLDKWRVAMKRATSTGELWMPSRYQRLCSLHFKQSCFDTTGQTKRLRDDVIPSIFNFTDDIKTEIPEKDPMPATSEPTEPEVATMAKAVQTLPANKEAINNCIQLQDHLYFTPDVETLKKKLQASEYSRAQKEKELRNAKEREKRLRQTCPTIYRALRKRKLLSPQLQEKLQQYGDIPLDLFKKPVSEYSAQQRLFSLTLQLHDPSSYRYIGNGFKVPLPRPRKLRQWLKTDCDKPAFNSLVLEALLKKKEEHPEVYSLATLVVDTMSIQQHVTFDSQQNELVGFVNLGKSSAAGGSQEVADETLMFMLEGTVGNWEAPIAYFFVKSLTAEAQKQLLLHVLHELWDNDIVVDVIAMDRNLRNQEMCSLLGCDFSDAKHLQTHFYLPNSDRKHYIVFSVHQELKLVTDMLQETGSIQSSDGLVLWKYIDDILNLEKLQILLPVEMITQLIKIKLTLTKLSYSVANALSMLQELKSEKFAESTATIKFIQVVHQLFSILCSSSSKGRRDNGPIDSINLKETLHVLQTTKEYLLSLTITDNYPVYQSSRGWYILGFIANITSFTALLPYLLQYKDCILTHRFSTERLKMFFNSIRKTGQSDESPTALEVKLAVQQRLCQCGLLNINKQNHPVTSEISFVHVAGDPAPSIYTPGLESPFEENSIMLPDHFYGSRILDTILHNAQTYIAGWVVQKAFSQLSCTQCRCALVTSHIPQNLKKAYHLLKLKHGRVYFVPSEGTNKIVETAEKELNNLLNNDQCDPRNYCFLLQHHVLSSLGSNDIFNFNMHIIETEIGIDNHYFQLLRMVTTLYYELRQPYIAKLMQRKHYKAHVKHILTQPVHVFAEEYQSNT